MKIILFLALITLATCELYHYQECVRGTTVLLKEPCSSGTYEGNSPFHPLADNKFAQLEVDEIDVFPRFGKMFFDRLVKVVAEDELVGIR